MRLVRFQREIAEPIVSFRHSQALNRCEEDEGGRAEPTRCGRRSLPAAGRPAFPVPTPLPSGALGAGVSPFPFRPRPRLFLGSRRLRGSERSGSFPGSWCEGAAG